MLILKTSQNPSGKPCRAPAPGPSGLQKDRHRFVQSLPLRWYTEAMDRQFKKGDIVNVLDSDGLGSTRAQVIEAAGRWLTVKWLEARWNLSANVMLNRKGTKSEISADRVA